MKTTLRPAQPPGSLRDDSRVAALAVYGLEGVALYPLADGRSYAIGRAADNDIVITHDAVSRRHAVIHGGPRPMIEDLQSSNGLRVAGRLLEPGQRAPLELGSILQIGPTVMVVQAGATLHETTRGAVEPAPHAAPEAAQPSMVFRDPRMVQVYQTAAAVAPGDISVLILGETGVGKELLARAIHSMSSRAARDFVKFNSAALPEQLVESELFGHEPSTISGAEQGKAGLFERADGGTLFLDEVSDLSLTAQSKLLRVLETGAVLRIGSLIPKPVKVRLVCATNRNLPQLFRAGTFRQDLFYRLNGVTVRVPPLRKRPLDIAVLVELFAARAGGPGKVAPSFTPAALSKLAQHAWPGNIRELRNVVERAALLSRGGSIDADDLQLEDERASSGALPVARTLSAPLEALDSAASDDSTAELAARLKGEIARQERARIVEALARAHGNQTVAADLLGISRRTLLTRLDMYSIPRPRKGGHDTRGD
jgi:DNA-binding NtrC family response regulator